MPKCIADWLVCAEQQLRLISESPRLDAEVLLAHSLGQSRSHLRAWPEKPVPPAADEQFQTLLTQRCQGTPVAYLTGEREFWSRSFKVNHSVLIPRPDTELIVELALERLAKRQNCKVIDLGTGSGVIAITLAAERPTDCVIASDISQAALAIAAENAEHLKISNLQFRQSNWFAQIDEHDFDMVISNPPYIAADDPHLAQGDVRFEPRQALISPENGLHDIRQLADQARQYLKADGYLLIEHGYQQSLPVQNILKHFNFRNVITHCDLSGNPRVTLGQWQPL